MAKTKHGVVTISEDIDMDGMLAKIPVDMRNKAGAEAVKAATRVVAKAYRARLPKGKTGNLKRSVTTILRRYGDGTIWFGAAGARHPTGNHMHLIELGHNIVPRGRAGARKRLKQRIGRMKDNFSDLFKATKQAATLASRIKKLEKSFEGLGKRKPLSGKARVEGKFDLVKAIDTTRKEQDRAVIDSLVKSIKKNGG